MPRPRPAYSPTSALPFPSPRRGRRFAGLVGAACGASLMAGIGSAGAAEYIDLTGVPDYDWHMGCFGTATGNLAGYWDRHGLSDFYTGPTNGGLAPLTTFAGNRGIYALWATEGGIDGRPFSKPGHVDDYWVEYEYTGRDPWLAGGRTEHPADCLGDFIGLNQNKWSDLNGECSGNIDGYSFNYFDHSGKRRENYSPQDTAGAGLTDIQSGLRAWAAWRGYEAGTFSQLTDFNPDIQPGGAGGFTFEDLKAEIDAGYPVLLFMQAFGTFSRTLGGKTHQNPIIHGMLAFGYVIDDDGTQYVHYRTSWASGDGQYSAWNAANWTPNGELNLPLRGVIGFHPHPKITLVAPVANGLRLRWDGPSSTLHDAVAGTDRKVHAYVIDHSPRLNPADWQPVTEPTTNLEITLTASQCCAGDGFFRVRLVPAL